METLLVSGAGDCQYWFGLGDGKTCDAAKMHRIDLSLDEWRIGPESPAAIYGLMPGPGRLENHFPGLWM